MYSVVYIYVVAMLNKGTIEHWYQFCSVIISIYKCWTAKWKKKEKRVSCTHYIKTNYSV